MTELTLCRLKDCLSSNITNISEWTLSTLNHSLTIGNNLHVPIRYSVQAVDYLPLTDVPCVVSLYNKVYSESLTGSLFMTSNNGGSCFKFWT